MKKTIIITLALAALALQAAADEPRTVKLPEPAVGAGLPVMTAFKNRHSERQWADSALTAQDLANLLWAADGVNRPDGRRTAPSAMGKNDVDIYVLLADGAYLYLPATHELRLVAPGDHRALAVGPQTSIPVPPVALVYTTTPSRFGISDPQGAMNMGYIDAGMVSQNVGVCCAGTGLVNVPRATMDTRGLTEVLRLPEGTFAVLNDLVGYPAK